jgi:glucokinase-like ROK family protein
MQKATRQQLKEQNRELVFKILFESARTSRAEIARITGLSRATVSGLVAELIAEGLVVEVGMGVSIGGKLPIMLSVADDGRFMIALDLAYNHFRGAVVDLRGQIRQVITLPASGYDGKQAIEAAFNIIDQLVRLPYASFVGIGIAAPGLVNSREGIVVHAVNLNWRDLPLGSMLKERYGLPVVVQNDCQAAAMGEYIFGGLKPASQNRVVVRVGQGIGAGIIIGGKIFQGDGGGAGEIGHVVMAQSKGLPCRCGKSGCLETLSSSKAVVRRAQILASSGIKTMLSVQEGEITLDRLIEAYQAGDLLACQVVEQAGYYLGLAVSGLVATLNIHQIILMGEMTRFGQAWLEVVQKTMLQTTLARLEVDTHVQISTLRDNDVILGASALLVGNYSLLFKN